MGVLALFCIGVLLPYFVDDRHRVPSTEAAGGGHDPRHLWPQDGWAGLPISVAALLAVGLGPLVLLASWASAPSG